MPHVEVGTHAQPLPRSAQVLLLVDFINPLDFPGAETLAPAALDAAKATARLRMKLTARKIPTIYANDNYGLWRSEFRQVLAQCKRRKGPAGQVAKLLSPAAKDIAILKPRHSAFFGTPLELLLDQLKAKKLILAGLATDRCVQLTAMDAHLRGYKLWVPRDCTAAESPEAKLAALHYMRDVLECDIRAAGA